MEGGVTRNITNTPWQERSVSFSPDGRSLVYAAEKDTSWDVYTISIVREEEPYFYVSTVLKQESLVATGAEEFQPEYSPDGKGEVHNLTLSGYGDFGPKWTMDGKMMIWGSDRLSARAQGGYSVNWDVYGMFFSQAAFDRFNLTKEEFALLKEQEEEKVEEIKIDWNNLTERKHKLTIHTSRATDWILSLIKLRVTGKPWGCPSPVQAHLSGGRDRSTGRWYSASRWGDGEPWTGNSVRITRWSRILKYLWNRMS